MEPKDIIQDITFDQQAHDYISYGVEVMQKAVGSTYGPGGRNVMIKKKYVAPTLTHDGVTVARDLAGPGKRLKHNKATESAKLVFQAAEKTAKTAGDGTTATVVLLGELYRAGLRHVIAGNDPMVVRKQLEVAREQIADFIKSKSIKCTREKLEQVAQISCGDDELGSMISDLMWDVGADGMTVINYHNAPHIEVEKVTGYLFNNGYKNLNVEVEFEAPLVFVTQKRMAAKGDIIPILELMTNSNRQFIIVGDVAGAAADTLLWAIQNNKADGVYVPPPAYGNDGHDYFEDIAAYCGARLWLDADSFKDVALEDFGEIKRSRVSREKAILFGNNDKTGDAIAERVKAVKDQMKDTNVTPSLKESLEERLSKLVGKVSIIKVGAPSEVEREELFFRVEDSVEACKSALDSGIVAGGATTLAFASQLKDLPNYVHDALQQPFRLLMGNSAEDAGYRLPQVLNGKYGTGFNLRTMTEEPIDLIDAGVVDPTKVMLQVVANAFSVAAALLTTGTLITEVEDEPAKKPQ